MNTPSSRVTGAGDARSEILGWSSQRGWTPFVVAAEVLGVAQRARPRNTPTAEANGDGARRR